MGVIILQISKFINKSVTQSNRSSDRILHFGYFVDTKLL